MMMLHIPRAVRRHEDLVCLNQSRERRPTHRAGADRAAAFLQLCLLPMPPEDDHQAQLTKPE